MSNGDVHTTNFGSLYNRKVLNEPIKVSQNNQEYLEDLEDDHMMPGVIPTISNQVSNHMTLANGHLGAANKITKPRVAGTNGHIPNGRPNLRSMLQDAEMDSHI